MKSTIKMYERAETSELQSLLKNFEKLVEEGELLTYKYECDIREVDPNYEFQNNDSYQEMKMWMNDCEIDIHLIRMELNKRLWKEKK